MDKLEGAEFHQNFCAAFAKSSTKARLFAGLSSVLFALTNICVKTTLRFVHPMQLVAVCGSILLVFCIYNITFAKSEFTTNSLCKRNVFLLFVTGFLLLGVMNLENLALSMANAGNAVTVQYGSELLTAGSITCIILNRGRQTLTTCVLAFTSFGGIFIVFRQHGLSSYQETLKSQSTRGLFISAGSGVGYAFFYMFVKIATDRGIPLSLTLLVQSFFLVLGSLFLSVSYFQQCLVPDSLYIWTLYMTCGGLEAFGTMTSLRALATDQMLSVSVILTFEVALTYILELLVLHTVPTLQSVIGAIFVTISCIGMICGRL